MIALFMICTRLLSTLDLHLGQNVGWLLWSDSSIALKVWMTLTLTLLMLMVMTLFLLNFQFSLYAFVTKNIHCECFVLAIRTRAGTKNILKLAERMVVRFFASVSGSISHGWAVVSGMDIGDVKIISRKNIDDHGKSSGIVLGASTSFCLTVNPKKAYDILRDDASCSEVTKFLL